MAGETLKTITELLAGLPDNVSNLIKPVDVRNVVVNQAAAGVGAFIDEADLPATVVLPGAGTWVDINFELSADVVSFNPIYWDLDANARAINQFAADGVTVPAGFFRIAILDATLSVDFLSSSNVYEFAVGQNGVPVAGFVTVEEAQQTSTTEVAIRGGNVYDVTAQDAFSVMVRNLDGASNIELDRFSFLLEDVNTF